MNPTPSAPTNNSAAPAKQPNLPPEKSVWKRYSPHHEAPISLAGSFTIHLMGFGLLIFLGFLALKFGLDDRNKPVPVEPINIAGGGGGNPDGIGDGPGDGVIPKEAVTETTPPEKAPKHVDIGKVDPTVKEQPEPIPSLDSRDDGKQFVEKAKAAQVALGNTSKAARDKVKGLLAGKGQGGSGKGGGKDKGVGTGEGSGVGPGKNSGNIDIQREKRMIRWRMRFNVINGADYLNQLDSLGAILGVPDADGKLRIFRQLKRRPAQGQLEDLTKIQRIYWVDDDAQSVQSLAGALGLPRIPPHIVAFFPEQVEKDLLEKERRYAKGKQEDEIEETHFELIRRGLKSYEPVVVFQK